MEVYRGKDATRKFLERILEIEKEIKDVRRNHFNKPLIMSEEDEKSFKKAAMCHICGKKCGKDDRVRDHCHVTGKYRGLAYKVCNTKYRLINTIPVVFHNLRGYNSHLIMQEIGDIARSTRREIEVIPNNMESYSSSSLGKNIRFIDSLQFMSSSLKKLVSNLPIDKLVYTAKEFGDNTALMARKGVYPYDYMDSFKKFNKNGFPTLKAFYSQLTGEKCKDEDYLHAVRVWVDMKVKNMGKYHDLYLRSDVALLADVFEEFRRTCLENNKLDPCHYYGSPGLSWDAMLRKTYVELELMTDIDTYQFIEKGVRGDVSYISHRHSEANNKYMSDYD